jgi:hypothetical protein
MRVIIPQSVDRSLTRIGYDAEVLFSAATVQRAGLMLLNRTDPSASVAGVVITGNEQTRSAAVAAAEKAIDQALAQKKVPD